MDEELHLEIDNPKVPFDVIDNWCAKCLSSFGFRGSNSYRTYYFRNPKDKLLFQLKWL